MENDMLLSSLQGDKNKFIIQIKSRENNTWQGTIEWLEMKKTMSFRSALELMCLISSVLDAEK